MRQLTRNIKAACIRYRRALRLQRWPIMTEEDWAIKKRDSLREKLKDIW